MPNDKIEFTPSQLQAIERQGGSVLVSAGAGSGKTTILVERLVRRIKADPDTDIDDFVIITFTKAAAGELRGKISSRLSAEAGSDPSNSHLRRQVALCTQAKIGTIHSFCAQLLRQYPKEAGISPDFKIVSDERRDYIRLSTLEKVLDRYYAEMSAHEGFELLVNTAGMGRDDHNLSELVLSLHENMLSHPRPEKWASEMISLLEKDAADVIETPWGKEILDDALAKVSFWNSQYQDLMRMMLEDAKLSSSYLPSFSDTQSLLDALCRALSLGWDKAGKAAGQVVFPALKKCTGTEMPELAETAKDMKERCGKYIRKLQGILRSSSDQLLTEMRSACPPMKALLLLTLDFDSAFKAEKQRLNLLDYSDLEHLTFEMLENNPDIKKALSGRFAEVMVDEYQDVNAIQDAIFSDISCDGSKLFMVGDVKQSIYRFRLADPSIFIRKSAQVTPISLSENFRSRTEIVDSVNRIFAKCMSRELGDVDYDDNARLKFGADYYKGSVPVPELLIYERPQDIDKFSYEASMVAGRIQTLHEEGYRYGDIAVLLRSVSSAGPVYRDEFSKRGIPVETTLGSSFFSQREICDIVNILKTIDNPHNDVSLISCLRSMSFTPDDLTEIRACDRQHNLFSALQKCGSKKCVSFLDTLSVWRQNIRDMTMDRFLMSLNRPVTSNFLKLVDISVSFENDGYHGVHQFVKYLDRLRESGRELTDANLGSDAVHIMSIHKSKGLEFPAVFLCDTTHQFNFSDAKDIVLVHPELGLGPKYVDFEKRLQYPTLARSAIAQRLKRETRSEELRLLYVALTRAKERLYITASPDKSFSEPLILSDVLTPFEWLLACDIPKRRIPFSEDEEKLPEETVSSVTSYSELPDFDYPYVDSTCIPACVTATELKKLFESEESGMSLVPEIQRHFRKPDFTRSPSNADASERGSAMHRALQYIDFGKPVREEIDRLEKEGFISHSDSQIVDSGAIESFLSSPLGVRLKCSKAVRREFKFLLLVDSRDLLETSVSEDVLLNGVVDCAFEEDGEIVIIDYKTDREDRTEQYTPQLKAYTLALSRVFGRKVRDAYIYYLNLGYEKRITV